MSENKQRSQTDVINHESETSIDTRLTCGRIFNDHFGTNSPLSPMMNYFVNWRTFGNFAGKKVDCLRRFLRIGTMLLKHEEFVRHIEYGGQQLSI